MPYMNCRNHRLALCMKHLIKQYPLLADADETLLSIWKLFHYSPKRFAVFQNIQEVYGDRKVTLIRAAATRWLSHGNACIRFIDRYEACLDALDQIYQEKREPDVQGLRSAITNKNTVQMILLLCDILKPINTLSESLQKADINFLDVDIKVRATLSEHETLKEMIQNREGYPDLYFSKCDNILAEINDRTEFQRRLRGDNFLSTYVFVREQAIPLIYSLISEITDGFTCHPVFKAFKALDPRALPESPDQLADYGMQSLETLSLHYARGKEDIFKGHVNRCPPDIDSQELLLAEYRGFKQQMYMFSSFPNMFSTHGGISW